MRGLDVVNGEGVLGWTLGARGREGKGGRALEEPLVLVGVGKL